MSDFYGVWTALATPFKKGGGIDEAAFTKLLGTQIDAKIHGIIPCGTTGESPTLTIEEKKRLTQIALSETKGTETKVIVGTGSNETESSVELSKWVCDQGAYGVLLVTPYYNKPTQPGLIKHFKKIADAVSGKVMLYNVPSRTSVSMTAGTVLELASHPKIRGLKESTGNVAFTSEILDLFLKNKNQTLDILSGDDSYFLPLMSVGATGVVSVASNLFPKQMVDFYNAIVAGDRDKAIKLNGKYFPMFRDLFVETNPAPIKYALSLKRICEPNVRLPLVELLDSSKKIIEDSIAQSGVL